MYGLERSQFNWSTSDLVWSALICFKILCMVLKGVNSMGLHVIQFDPVWSALKSYNVWFWKESVQLVYKWSGLIVIDLLWSVLICFKILCVVLKGVNSIGLQVICFDWLWSVLICFKILCMFLKEVKFNWSTSDKLWSALIQLKLQYSQVIWFMDTFSR